MAKVTDKNDNLVDEEWEETPSGHFKGFINLDTDSANKLTDCWIEDNCSEATLELYEELLITKSRQEAVHEAIINESLLAALTSMLNKLDKI